MKRLLGYLEYIGIWCVSFLPLIWGYTRYPKLVGDEGIYISQAWWLIGFGKLGPYTYWYDHFPLGWFMLGLWQKLTGGPFTFGVAEFSGRLFIILLVSCSFVLLYDLIKQISHSKIIGLIVIAAYAFSPLSTVFHRQVLLENISLFWLILALWLLFVKAPKKPYLIIPSALTYGLAILTKESLLFTVPAYLIGCWLELPKTHRFALFGLATLTLFCTISLFPLLAYLKGELVTSGASQISLLAAMRHQIERGNYLPWWRSTSEFRQRLSSWLYLDPIFLILGLGTILGNFITDPKNKQKMVVHFIAISFIGFLIRGGLVLDYYIIPLLPLLALEIGFFLSQITQNFRIKTVYLIPCLLLLVAYNLKSGWSAFTANVTHNQLEAYNYIESHANPQDVIVTDNYFFLNLRYNTLLAPKFPNTDWYTKVESDPYVKKNLQINHQGNIDWLLLDDTINQGLMTHSLPIIQQAKQSQSIAVTFPLPQQNRILSLYQQVPYILEPISIFHRTLSTDNNAQVPLRQQLGKLIWFTPTTTRLTPAERQLLNNANANGIVLSKKNIQNTDQLQNLIADIQATATISGQRPTIAISFEGGQDTPIPWFNGVNPGTLKSSSEAEEMAATRAEQLTQAGFNAILGPIIDKRSNGSIYDQLNNVPRDHGFSLMIAKTYQINNLVPLVKWFPGTNSNLKGEIDLEPYQQLCSTSQEPMGIMVDSSPPQANLSELITILRQSCNFTGHVFVWLTYQSGHNHHRAPKCCACSIT